MTQLLFPATVPPAREIDEVPWVAVSAPPQPLIWLPAATVMPAGSVSDKERLVSVTAVGFEMVNVVVEGRLTSTWVGENDVLMVCLPTERIAETPGPLPALLVEMVPVETA